MFLYASGGSLYFTSVPSTPAQLILYEVNPASGTIKAAYQPPHTGWDSPTVVDHTLYYMDSSNLYAEQLPTKKMLWHVPLTAKTSSQQRSMFIQNDRVYIATNVVGTQALGYTLIDAFDARTGKMLWRSPEIPQNMNIIAIADTMIYASSYGSKIYAIDAQNGKLVWQQAFAPSALLATSDVLYLNYSVPGADQHNFLALREKDGTKLWQQSFSHLNDYASLILLNDTLYSQGELNPGKTGDSNILYAFDAHTGSLRWKILLDFGVISIA